MVPFSMATVEPTEKSQGNNSLLYLIPGVFTSPKLFIGSRYTGRDMWEMSSYLYRRLYRYISFCLLITGFKKLLLTYVFCLNAENPSEELLGGSP